MRYKDITENPRSPGRAEAQIFRGLIQQFKSPLAQSISEYNKAIAIPDDTITVSGPPLNMVSITEDPMFRSMALTMFRMGYSKEDAGKVLPRNEPKEQLALIKKFSEKKWFQILTTKGGHKTMNPDVQAGYQFKTPENLAKELALAPPNVFGENVEKMITNQYDVYKFYALVDFFEIVLTTMNIQGTTPSVDQLKKAASDFERDVTGDGGRAQQNYGWVAR
ncbi:MAG: hypothetical protein CMA64_00915 [Euryarchaeota archaeon]|nr:hypothetical protein [Euryarchaeota archaeon]